MTNPEALLPPGFRFHPTDEELILHYLRNRDASRPCPVSIIAEVDIYKFDPWDLPDKAVFGDKEWYFFTPRDRKYPNGLRPNRAAGSGYWKATGIDKPITTSAGTGRKMNIGLKKALVFYVGKPPKGTKTEWMMHEYRLTGRQNSSSNCSGVPYQCSTKQRGFSMRLEDWVLCRIFKKHTQSPTTKTTVSDLALSSQSFDPHDDDGASDRLHQPASWSDILENADYGSALSLLLQDDIGITETSAGNGGSDAVSLSDHGSSSQKYYFGSCTPEPSLGLSLDSGVKWQTTTEDTSRSCINGSSVKASSRCNLLAQAYLKHQQMMSNSRPGLP